MLKKEVRRNSFSDKFNKSNKKSQFTAFVILGIVLIAMFGFMLFARYLIVNARMNTQVEETISSYVNSNSIDYYVTSCLKRATEEAVITASLQGGRIYDYQGGPIQSEGLNEGEDYISYTITEHNYDRTVNVSYGVIPNTQCSISNDGYVYDSMPYYPYPRKKLSELDLMSGMFNCTSGSYEGIYKLFISQGFFGFNNLTKLCECQGPNMVSEEGGVNIFCRMKSLNCPLNFVGGADNPDTDSLPLSIQEQIAFAIENMTQECVDFEFFEGVTSTNITVEDKPEVTVMYGENNINVKVSYPFKVSIKNHEPVTKMVDFEISPKIPLKEIYNCAFYLAEKDVTNHDFDYMQDYILYCNPSLFEVNKIDNVYPEDSFPSDDIVQVIYKGTSILGKPIIFQFALKNRNPALDYIVNSGYYNATYNFWYDVIASEGSSLTLAPEGYDPDDSPVVFYDYSGWKQDYNETFDFNCWNNVVKRNITRIDECMIRLNDEEFPFPQSWKGSETYKTTYKDATYYDLNRNDSGIHNVTITIWDVDGTRDFQNVRILVFDFPTPNITGDNFYADIDNNYSSIEDPYIFNGSLSKPSQIARQSIVGYIWNESLENINNYTIKDFIILPNDTNAPPRDILSIKNLLHFKIVANHTMNLTLDVSPLIVPSPTKSMVVNVTQCLPHRDDSPAYPYNYDSVSPFQANHSCCNADFEYFGEDKICYNDVIYGSSVFIGDSIVDLNRKPDAALDVFGSAELSYDYDSVNLLEDYANDIFKLDFTRRCSGERGNICGGDMEAGIDLIDSCEDNPELHPLASGTAEARCSGPADIDEPLSSSDSCIFYDETTFEFEAGLNDNTFCWVGSFCENDILNTNLTCNENNGNCDVAADKYDCSEDSFCDNSGSSVVYKKYGCIGYSPSSECGHEYNINPDNDEDVCLSHAGDGGCNYFNGRKWGWVIIGYSGKCCGDDYNEYYTESYLSGTHRYCCNSDDMCAYMNNCYPDGYVGNGYLVPSGYVCNGASNDWYIP
ncbi:hypothetical protein JW949_01155 [Candidatus Woesearchaeota archaeon]|nr:hypothetical protein [Candidatus Woesearchaeota archaeon]